MVNLLSQITGIDNTVTREILGNVDSLSRTIFYVLTVFALCSFFHGLWSRWTVWRQGRRRDSSTESMRFRVIFHRVIERILLQRRVRRQRKEAGRAHVLLFGGFGILFIGTVLIAIEHYSAAAIGRSAEDPIFHKGLYFVIYEFVLDTAERLNPTRTVVVVGHQADRVEQIFSNRDLEFVLQKEQLGTGHAARQAEKTLANFEGRILANTFKELSHIFLCVTSSFALSS